MEEEELGWASEDVDEDFRLVWLGNRLSVTRQQTEKNGYISRIGELFSIDSASL